MKKILLAVGLVTVAATGAMANIHHPHHHGPHGHWCGTLNIGPHECPDDVCIYLVDNK